MFQVNLEHQKQERKDVQVEESCEVQGDRRGRVIHCQDYAKELVCCPWGWSLHRGKTRGKNGEVHEYKERELIRGRNKWRMCRIGFGSTSGMGNCGGSVNTINSLTPMGACAQLFNELRDHLITFLLFVRWQRLIARNDRELFSSNRGVSHLTCRINELSRGSILGYEILTNN